MLSFETVVRDGKISAKFHSKGGRIRGIFTLWMMVRGYRAKMLWEPVPQDRLSPLFRLQVHRYQFLHRRCLPFEIINSFSAISPEFSSCYGVHQIVDLFVGGNFVHASATSHAFIVGGLDFTRVSKRVELMEYRVRFYHGCDPRSKATMCCVCGSMESKFLIYVECGIVYVAY